MNIRSQIIIDKYIVQVIAIILNLLARVLGKIVQINHSLERDFRRIAVCKYKGMGSIIQATPMLQALREKYPDAEITFISSIQNKSILEKISIIDNYILIDDRSFFRVLRSFPVFLTQLINKRIQLYFDLEIYSNFSSIVTLLSLSTNRIGFYLRSGNYRMGIYSHMLFYNMRLPIHQVYLQLTRVLKIDEKEYRLYKFGLEINKIILPDKNEFDLTQQDYIVINPNASDLRIERRWDAEGFIAVINKLTITYPNLSIFLIGSKDESVYVNDIFEKIERKNRVYNLSGTTSINQLISIIGNAKLMITNDTGPMHIGFCTDTTIVALFGPCLPNQYGINNNSIILFKDVYCSPCVHEFIMPPCKGNNTCMKSITIIEVLNAVVGAYENNNIIPNLQKPILYYSGKDALGMVNRAK